MHFFIKRSFQAFTKMPIRITDTQGRQSVKILWLLVPKCPFVFINYIHNLNFDLELIPVVCFRTQMRIMCDSMTIELKLMNHEAVDLKSVINVSYGQVRKLKRIVSKSYRILLEVSDRTGIPVELIALRTTVFGHSPVPQSSVV